MPVIGATELQPVNILGSYVQGLEGARANRMARAQEAAMLREMEEKTALRNMLMGATEKDLQDPSFLNRLAITPGGAATAQSLAQSMASQRAARKSDLEATRLEVERLAGQAGAFLQAYRDNPASLNKAAVAPWLNSAVRRGLMNPEDLQTFDAMPDDPAALAIELQKVQAQGMSIADQMQFQRPKGTTTEVGGVIVTTDPFTGKEIGKVDYSAAEQAARAAGRSSQVVNLPPSESERGKVLGRLGGEALVAEYNAAQSASKGLSKDYEAIRLLREGKPATGITSELETTFNRFRADVAGDKEAAAKVSDSQFLEALLGSDVFNQIAALGVGARGLDTPAEREFLREVISGTRKLDKDTLIRMAELRAKYKEDAVDAYNERVRSGELDEFFRDFGRPKREFAKPERPAAPQPLSGGPKIGAIENGYRFKGGDPSKPASWEKVKVK